MFNPSRDEARRFFFDTWRKHQANDTLTDLERMTLAIILLHPEYHPVLDAPARYLEREWLPEDGQTNPFLHLAMHLSIEEQLSIDQPPGIRARIDALSLQHQDRHPALHDAMDGLAEMIWHAQRYQTPPDPQLYLHCLDRKLGRDPDPEVKPLPDDAGPELILPPR